MSTELREEFHFPEEKGFFDGTFVDTRWAKRRFPCLLCFFETDDGRRIILPGYQSDSYGPYADKVSFTEAEYGTRWHCEFEMSRNGTTRWMKAKRLEG